jgi:hypothetical protein
VIVGNALGIIGPVDDQFLDKFWKESKEIEQLRIRRAEAEESFGILGLLEFQLKHNLELSGTGRKRTHKEL